MDIFSIRTEDMHKITPDRIDTAKTNSNFFKKNPEHLSQINIRKSHQTL